MVAGDDLQAEDFTFAIKEIYDNQSWQGSDEALNDRDGKATFAEKECAETGNYKYTITETIEDKGEGWVFDKRKRTLTVKVKARGTENGPEL